MEVCPECLYLEQNESTTEDLRESANTVICNSDICKSDVHNSESQSMSEIEPDL